MYTIRGQTVKDKSYYKFLRGKLNNDCSIKIMQGHGQSTQQ